MRALAAHPMVSNGYDAGGVAQDTGANGFKQAMATDWGLVGIAMGFVSVYTPIR